MNEQSQGAPGETDSAEFKQAGEVRIDAHHHVWDLTKHPQTWMTAEQARTLGRNFTIDDWATAAANTPVTHSVVVQTIEDPTETPELLELASGTPSIAGVVGWIDIDAGDPKGQLAALQDGPGGEWLVSIRDLTQYREDLDWLASAPAREAFRAAGRRGLAVDLLITPATVPAAKQAVAASPDTRFVINHLAKPDLDSVAPEAWGADMQAFADADNVAVKLSGMATLTADFSTVGEQLAGYVAELLSRFGAERILFGSDWPVSNTGASYSAVVAGVASAISGLSPAEQARIWGGSALDWYDLRVGASQAEAGESAEEEAK